MAKDARLTIVARRGDDSFLIMNGDNLETAQGIVVDRKLEERYLPKLLQSILSRGYWEPYDHDDDLLDKLMEFTEQIKCPIAATENPDTETDCYQALPMM